MADETFKGKITAQSTEISVLSQGTDDDYISLTDIARYKNPEDPNGVVANWLRNRNTVEFLGVWEQLYNPDFKSLEFEGFRREAGLNAFTLSPSKWIRSTDAIGIVVKSGRGGGTFAHKDIAFEFASWISNEFKLYIIKDYQRLKSDENSRISLDWNVKRILAKVNYRIHTDAIRDNLIPPEVTGKQKSFVYADEADLLNAAQAVKDDTAARAFSAAGLFAATATATSVRRSGNAIISSRMAINAQRHICMRTISRRGS